MIEVESIFKMIFKLLDMIHVDTFIKVAMILWSLWKKRKGKLWWVVEEIV